MCECASDAGVQGRGGGGEKERLLFTSLKFSSFVALRMYMASRWRAVTAAIELVRLKYLNKENEGSAAHAEDERRRRG